MVFLRTLEGSLIPHRPILDERWAIERLSMEKGRAMLTVAMVVLAMLTFAAMLGFVSLCDRV
jgi:hypothetical protein